MQLAAQTSTMSMYERPREREVIKKNFMLLTSGLGVKPATQRRIPHVVRGCTGITHHNTAGV